MKRVLLAALAAAPLLAAAAEKCSIPNDPDKKKSELLAQVKINTTQAQATAMDVAKAEKKVRMGLEWEGCFVYDFVVANAKGDRTAVTIDPVTGKVLRNEKLAAAPKQEAPAHRQPTAAEMAPKMVPDKSGISPAVPKAPPPPKK